MGDAIDPLACRGGIAALPGAVDRVAEGLLSLSAGGTRGRIGRDPLVPHHLSKVLPPLPQHRLVDMKASLAVLALGLDDQVHMRVVLMSVQHHGVSMLRAELLARENLRCRQYLSRGCRRGHR